MNRTPSPSPRRSFLARIAAAPFIGGLFAAGGAVSPAAAASGSAFEPARHAEDDWLDALPGKHRFFFDTTTPTAIGQGVFFANNYYTANKNAYGVEAKDLAVVIGLRHQSTAFAFSDAMWAKYGAGLAERANGFTDPKTSAVPVVNVYRASGYGQALPNLGVTIDAVAKNGAHFAVCQMASRACAAAIARRTGGKPEDIYTELTSNLIPNAHMVPAGIVAVNRAQERGYSFVYVA
jgi:intracellular sulfur oxidation DsrE/DsrF family protein